MKLSNFGLGCWAFGLAEPGSDDERTAKAIVRRAYDRGVRHFDSAQGYGEGRSEEVVGAALSGLPDAEIATKSALVSDAEAAGKTAERTAELLETSRRRLGRDVIDLFYIHWPRKGVDPRPMLGALEEARAKGLLRKVGVSNFPVEQLKLASEVAHVDVHQVGFSLLWRYPEHDVIPYCRDQGIEVFSYSSLAQGLLTGKMPRKPHFEAGDPRPETVFYDDAVWPHVYEAVGEMNAVAAASGNSLHHLALHWLVHLAGVSRVLVGARSDEQLSDNLAAMSAETHIPDLEALQRISDEVHRHIPDIGNIFKYYP